MAIKKFISENILLFFLSLLTAVIGWSLLETYKLNSNILILEQKLTASHSESLKSIQSENHAKLAEVREGLEKVIDKLGESINDLDDDVDYCKMELTRISARLPAFDTIAGGSPNAIHPVVQQSTQSKKVDIKKLKSFFKR